MSNDQTERTSELTLDEVIGLQGWTLNDLLENRQGRLSASQTARLLEGQSELFGLLHIRIASKHEIEAGIVESYVGVARDWAGPHMANLSLQLTVDDRPFFIAYNQRLGELVAQWVAQQQRLRVYLLAGHLVAVEPVTT